MRHLILKTSALFLLMLPLFFTACTDDSIDELEKTEDINLVEASAELYSDYTLFEIQELSSTGPYGCFEFVFPITIAFTDGTQNEVADYEALRAAVIAWKESNPDRGDRPMLVFPLEVISEDGDVHTINGRPGLIRLKLACHGVFPGKGERGHGKCHIACFKLVYPITIQFPDETTAEAADKAAFKVLIRTWRANNPTTDGRPVLVFPIQVEMRVDGSIVTVEDRAALRTLKRSCRD